MAYEKHYCEVCGEELVPKSMVMLLLSVYGQFRALYQASGGFVKRREFKDWLREKGPMDDEQLDRVFGFLRECGFVSNSSDREYLIYGVGEEAEKAHRRNIWNRSLIEAQEEDLGES